MMINNRLKFIFLLIFLVLLSLACDASGASQVPNVNNPPDQPPNANNPADQPANANNPADQPPDANNPPEQQVKPNGFSEADCNVSGVTFANPDFGYSVDDIYDGPYLTCSFSGEGAHGLTETAYISISANKAGPILVTYQDLNASIKRFVDQSTEWNAQPDLPPEVRDEITFLRDESDGYIFLITRDANVQECTLGDGYGVEIVDGKYLVQYQFGSCEGDAAIYLTALQNLQTAARDAIRRVEASAQP